MMSLFVRSALPLRAGIAAVAAAVLLLGSAAHTLAQTDLDGFMAQVLASRDSNWRKLQQYVLDEREQFEMRDPANAPLWGERRDYTWFIRDGFFVRSPLRVNGGPVSDADRRAYESDFLERAKRRDARAAARSGGAAPDAASDADTPRSLDGLIRQTRQPQFISSAYFLRFRFDEGRYALVGREVLDGRDVLRIEYYPEKLFTEERRREMREELEGDRRRPPERNRDQERSFDAEMRRLMNKASKVTLWIEPASHQILKYTFDDLGWDFFPGQWLARVDGVTASMTMGQPFPDVWLPRGLEMNIGMQLAFGTVQMRYTLAYENYRQADVQSRIVPDRP